MDEQLALRLVAGIVSVGGILTSLENLRHWTGLRRWFVQPWQTENRGDQPVRLSVKWFAAATRPRLLWLLYLRLALFVGLLASSLVSPRPSGVLALLLAVLLVVDFSVRVVGGDGADQMTVLVCLAIACAAILNTPFATAIGLAFLAAQAWLAYVTAGVAKLISREWMRVGVLGRILGTQTYGHELAASVFQASPRLDRMLSASVGAMEVMVPVLCLLPFHHALVAGLAIGLSFHAACALLMGLNNFVYAFVATYPAIYYTHRAIYG